MNLVDYAKINGISPEKFVEEISATFASVMSIEFDKVDANVVKMSYLFSGHKIKIVVTKEDIN